MGQLLSYCKKEDGSDIECTDDCNCDNVNINCVKINYVEKNEENIEKKS